LNKSDVELARGGRTYKVGDKAMQIKNDYDKEVLTGTSGGLKGLTLKTRWSAWISMDDWWSMIFLI